MFYTFHLRGAISTIQDINPIYFLTGIVPIVLSVGLIFYWRKKRTFKWIVLVYSLIAYAGAIALKYAIQIPTVHFMINTFGYVSPEMGFYYGIQTSILEVGGAYVMALIAVRQGRLFKEDAESYGLSLSFWENAVLLGAVTTLNLVTDYLIIAYGPPSIASYTYHVLLTAQPALFQGIARALVPVGFSILERISSLLAHLSWGILAILAAALKKKLYFYIALPMGFLDGLVPYVGQFGVAMFETVIFLLSVLFITIAVYFEKTTRDQFSSSKPIPKA